MRGAVRGEVEEESAYMWEPVLEKRWQQPIRKRKRDEATGSKTRSAGRRSQVRVVRVRGGSEEVSGDEEGAAADGGGVEMWNSNRLKRAMQKASLQHIGVKLNIMA